MTAHSISILSELKMTSFGPYAGVKAPLSISCAVNCSLLKAMPNVLTVPQLCELIIGTHVAGQGIK